MSIYNIMKTKHTNGVEALLVSLGVDPIQIAVNWQKEFDENGITDFLGNKMSEDQLAEMMFNELRDMAVKLWVCKLSSESVKTISNAMAMLPDAKIELCHDIRITNVEIITVWNKNNKDKEEIFI